MRSKPRLPELPDGIEMREVEGAGRSMFATRDFPSDTVIASASPVEGLGYVIDPHCSRQVCDVCVGIGVSENCGGCGGVWWCSDCAEEGRRRHEGRECSAFVKLKAEITGGSDSQQGLKTRIERMYMRYNSSKLSEVDALLRKYEARQLLDALVSKYGPEPEVQSAEGSGDEEN
eukprot:Hpha_TRINITY_DN23152_c0_g1::TRINITY_DN23152_c0_g1_i1::g.29673::m.29673